MTNAELPMVTEPEASWGKEGDFEDTSPDGAAVPRVRFPIRVKITLPYLILALVLALGSSYVVTQIVFDTIDERFNNQLIEGGRLGAEWMVRQENHLLEGLRVLAYTEGVADALEAGDAEGLRALTFGVAANRQEEAVEFVDAQGNLLLSMRKRPDAGVEAYDFGKNGDDVYRQWPFVEQVLAMQVDEHGDKYSGSARTPWGDFFYVSGPIYNRAGELAGVLLVGKRVESLVRQMKVELVVHGTIYEFNGQPLASTFLEARALGGVEAGSVLETQGEASLRRDLTSSFVEYSEILAPWESRNHVDIGLLGVALPKPQLVSPSLPTRIKISGLVGVALFLIILLGVNLARVITRPLLGLVQASLKVAQGDLRVQVAPSGNDEVAILASSFNDMVSSLYSSKMDLLKAYDDTLEALSLALELRDSETEGHTRRATEMTLDLARAMGMQDEQLEHVRRGAMMHDIGKMGVPDGILLKPGELTKAEWEIMRRHPEYAYEMLRKIDYLHPALDIPYCHHERWDGGGYPRGLKEEEIPLAARIFAVVDVWEAMRSDRPYRAALPEAYVLEQIRAGSGTHFDPQVVEAFFSLIGKKESGA